MVVEGKPCPGSTGSRRTCFAIAAARSGGTAASSPSWAEREAEATSGADVAERAEAAAQSAPSWRGWQGCRARSRTSSRCASGRGSPTRRPGRARRAGRDHPLAPLARPRRAGANRTAPPDIDGSRWGSRRSARNDRGSARVPAPARAVRATALRPRRARRGRAVRVATGAPEGGRRGRRDPRGRTARRTGVGIGGRLLDLIDKPAPVRDVGRHLVAGRPTDRVPAGGPGEGRWSSTSWTRRERRTRAGKRETWCAWRRGRRTDRGSSSRADATASAALGRGRPAPTGAERGHVEARSGSASELVPAVDDPAWSSDQRALTLGAGFGQGSEIYVARRDREADCAG